MTSIPPSSGRGGWEAYRGRPFVAVEPRPDRVFDVTVSSGALLRDFIDVTATLPSIVYVDHRPVTRGGTDVTLIFRSMREGGSGVGGGWVPPDTPAGPAAWTSYQDSLHSLLLAAPGGPTGERLVGELVHLDPRSVVALADILCRRHPARA